jgi:hypothetical protein
MWICRSAEVWTHANAGLGYFWPILPLNCGGRCAASKYVATVLAVRSILRLRSPSGIPWSQCSSVSDQHAAEGCLDRLVGPFRLPICSKCFQNSPVNLASRSEDRVVPDHLVKESRRLQGPSTPLSSDAAKDRPQAIHMKNCSARSQRHCNPTDQPS